MSVVSVVWVRHIGAMALSMWVPVCLIVRVGIVEGLGGGGAEGWGFRGEVFAGLLTLQGLNVGYLGTLCGDAHDLVLGQRSRVNGVKGEY